MLTLSLRLPKTKTPGRSAWTRRTIVSDSEEENTDVDEEQRNANKENDNDDGAILVLNDPPTARRPLPKPNALPTFARLTSMDLTNDVKGTPGGGRILTADRTPLQTPVQDRPSEDSEHMPRYIDTEPPSPIKVKGGKRKNLKDNALSEGPSKPATPTSVQVKKGGRISKKALEAARQEKLQAYAAQLFNELNEKVFNNKLPSTTTLKWNKRLQTTAGKASWHLLVQAWLSSCLPFDIKVMFRSATNNVETTSIELAPKVLDCEGKSPSSESIAEAPLTLSLQNAFATPSHMKCVTLRLGSLTENQQKITVLSLWVGAFCFQNFRPTLLLPKSFSSGLRESCERGPT